MGEIEQAMAVARAADEALAQQRFQKRNLGRERIREFVEIMQQNRVRPQPIYTRLRVTETAKVGVLGTKRLRTDT
jgi:hypothetical protein